MCIRQLPRQQYSCAAAERYTGAHLLSLSAARLRWRRQHLCRVVAAIKEPDGLEQWLGVTVGNCKHFVNLTNGVEAVPVLQKNSVPFGFIRVQSSQCESQAMEKVMLELDSSFLIALALGWPCVVWDFGSRNRPGVPLEGVPRAAW